MKTVKHIYERLLDEEFIRKCIFKAAKGKRKRRDVRRVLNNIPHTVNVIKETLGTDSFKPAVHYLYIKPYVDYEFLTKIESCYSKGVILNDSKLLRIRERLNARRN